MNSGYAEFCRVGHEVGWCDAVSICPLEKKLFLAFFSMWKNRHIGFTMDLVDSLLATYVKQFKPAALPSKNRNRKKCIRVQIRKISDLSEPTTFSGTWATSDVKSDNKPSALMPTIPIKIYHQKALQSMAWTHNRLLFRLWRCMCVLLEPKLGFKADFRFRKRIVLKSRLMMNVYNSATNITKNAKNRWTIFSQKELHVKFPMSRPVVLSLWWNHPSEWIFKIREWSVCDL